MNGRMYDPVVGRMLSTDNNIIGAYSTQGYDRYGYALNNPLKYTDPDGEHPLIAAAVGAVLGVVGNGISNALSGEKFFKGAGKAAVWGAISGLTFNAVGTAFGGLGSFGHEAGRAAAHGAVNMVMSTARTLVEGGDPTWGMAASSFGAGSFSSMFGSGFGAAHAKLDVTPRAFGTTMAGGFGGAFGAAIMGGDPVKGFTQGAIFGGTNHAMHVGLKQGPGDPPDFVGFKEKNGGIFAVYSDGSEEFLPGVLPSQSIQVTDSPIEWFLSGGIVKSSTVALRANVKFATGGMKQWFRVGKSYSIAGGFKTYGLRWGASPRYANKIGNLYLRSLNQSFRTMKLGVNNWRFYDGGHFHFYKRFL